MSIEDDKNHLENFIKEEIYKINPSLRESPSAADLLAQNALENLLTRDEYGEFPQFEAQEKDLFFGEWIKKIIDADPLAAEKIVSDNPGPYINKKPHNKEFGL